MGRYGSGVGEAEVDAPRNSAAQRVATGLEEEFN